MARKRSIFFHSIFTFLRTISQRAIGSWTRVFSVAHRSTLAIYVLLAVLTALICTTALPGFARITIAQTTVRAAPAQTEAQKLEKQGREYYKTGHFSEAAAVFKQAAILYQRLGSIEQSAESRINQARALQALGLYNQAIAVLQKVLQDPEQPTPLLQDLNVEVRCSEDNLVLNPLRGRLEALPVSSNNAAITAAALRGLGDALQVAGNLEESCTILRYSLELAKTQSLTDAIAPTYLSLGNLARTQAIENLRLNNLTTEQAIAQLQRQLSPIQQELQRRQTEAAQQFMNQTGTALDYYQQAANDSTRLIQAQAQLNTLSLLLDRQEWSEATNAIPPLYPLLNSLPLSRSAIKAKINLAHSLMRMAEGQLEPAARSPSSDYMGQAAQLLAIARQQASDLDIAQTESYALGSLGELYERTQQWSEAKALTQQALEKVNSVSVTNLPHTVSDADLTYRWYRQLGRILIAQGDREGAIEAYETAVKVLQERLRLDIASSNLNYQLSFNQKAQEPVHLELMDLLLQPEEPSQQNLQQVREIVSALLEAELTSFLNEPCAIATPDQLDTIVREKAQRTAIFYPLILPDRLETIVKLPDDQELIHYRHFIPKDRLLEKLNKLQLALEEDYTFEAVENLSQQFYAWIVQPAEELLKTNQVDTLVFTLGRQLQTIPMAALYDGETYLIDKYAVSEFLGLSVGGSVERLQQEGLKVIAAGLSDLPPSLPEESENNFLPLTYVSRELDAINTLQENGIPVTILKGEQFDLTNFRTLMNEDEFPVVHLATHGQFSVDPQKTFLLTSNVLIRVNDLAALFRTRGQIRLDSIELLVLNACETAAGDKLATLGLAGITVRAGASSAIASLWTLDDRSSVTFTRELYKNLQIADVSKAEALRQAQLKLMRDPQYRHPRYWSPYILVGNWLPLISSRSVGSADSR
ncbi:MAG: CHAT domain-containing protein [Xenococcaceae cyanobacterium MO_188.B29]|nr:CHAT domain-containing protein [Xenococcaceae cyanobacterium MO_188.B29]